MKINLSEIRLSDVGNWPRPVRLLAVSVACIIVACFIFWLDTQTQLDKLETARQQEQKDRIIFEEKQQQAATLTAYQKQLIEIKQSLGHLINQLPAQTEVPILVEDISKIGAASGLHFALVKPLAEQQLEFITELPITISVVGNYHQFGKFVSDVVALSRIVTLHDFSIHAVNVGETAPNAAAKLPVTATKPGLLQMDITAKTYSYKE